MDELNRTAIKGESSLVNRLMIQVGTGSSSHCLFAADVMSFPISDELKVESKRDFNLLDRLVEGGGPNGDRLISSQG